MSAVGGLGACVGGLWLLGFAPGAVLDGLLLKGFLSESYGLDPGRLAATLNRSSPIILCSVAVCLAFRCGVLNIGVEGQFIAGAVFLAWVGVTWGGLPGVVLLPLVLVGAGVCGAFWGLLAGLLKRYRHVNEVLGTLLLNFVAFRIAEWLVIGPLADPRYPGSNSTASISGSARLPVFGGELFAVHAGVLLAVGLGVGSWWLLRSTVAGYRMRLVGENATAARFAGVAVGRYQLLAFVLSGFLGGLAGAVLYSGIRFGIDKSPGADYGFTGIAAALLARLSPLGAIPAGLFFAMLEVGAENLQLAPGFERFPVQITRVITGMVILSALLMGRRSGG